MADWIHIPILACLMFAGVGYAVTDDRDARELNVPAAVAFVVGYPLLSTLALVVDVHAFGGFIALASGILFLPVVWGALAGLLIRRAFL